MRRLRLRIVAVLCIVFGSLLGSELGIVNTQESPEQIAGTYFENIKKRIDAGIDHAGLVAIVDSLWDVKDFDPRVIKLLTENINKAFEDQWPLDTNPYPAHDHYCSWNTLLPHPYTDEIRKGDKELVLELTHGYMDCGYAHPIKGVVTSRFGWRDGKHHNGIDIDLVRGDTVENAFRGVVRLAKWTTGYGRTVIVRHHNGLETIYAHLYKIMVQPGDIVDPGQPIGRGGNSGASRGSHLHFETRFKGMPINPEALIDFNKYELVSDSLVVRKTSQGYVGFQPGALFHKIQRGDYMYKIAQMYGVSINDICKWNGVKRNHLLVVGRELKVSE